ncbi:RHS repeat-associated protein [Streptomyces sp. TLI_235]|nr:RHS repeat-associated core domain-containing protein [Streptomyces sp. TLI_235]PBC71062.1 RHS repeat-associated protein [Streptomyces sp. TLI_235]
MRQRNPRLLTASVVTALWLGVLPASAAMALPARGGPDLPALHQPKAVPVKKVATGHGAQRPDQAAVPPGHHTPRATWPKAGTTAAGPGAAGLRPPGSVPVTVTPAVKPATAKSAAATKVSVTVADRAATARAGIEGIVLSVDTTSSSDVKLDYSSFADAYGGDWAARLRLVRLPGCALTTPERAECRVQQPLASVNDPKAGTVSAKVDPAPAAAGAKNEQLTLPGNGTAPASGPVLLAATAAPSGDSGSYRATSLQPSGSWSAGSSTGAFTWSYPIGAPAVPGGLQPTVSLGYSSQAVDGRTSASNNQASWLGDGWGWEPGFIERRYKPCDDDQASGNNTAKVGDQCWYNDNATLSLGGKNTELVYDSAKGWHPANDSGERVEKLTGTVNGDDNGEYWRITATDGVQYYFGLNRPPGWKDATTPETKSAWTVPVYGNQPGEPCYNASFANSWCQQAWRWQLDYVVDPRGDAMAYYWNQETNNYDRNLTTATPYIRSGWLDHIDYGLRSDTVYSAKAMGQVKFDVTERCLTGCATFDQTNAANWPDAPYDLNCKDGDDCRTNISPTFWSRKRLTGITTRLLTGGGYQDVDNWAFEQSFPPSGDGISTPMWLKSVTRTGKVGGSLPLPPVTFAGQQLANRVDKTGDGLAPFIRLRLSQVTTETGGTIGVYYSAPDCTATTLPPADATNTTRCFPSRRYEGSTPKDDWFNTYVVTRVVEGDNLADTPDKVTEYSYLDGAAWTRSEAELTKDSDRTYSVARGYGRVQTRTGAGSDARTISEDRYFRGIDGTGVKDSAGQAVTDRPQFAGQLRETATYNGDGGPLVTATSYTPWRSSPTATRPRTGLPDLEAYLTGTGTEQTRTTTSTGERRTSLTRTFDQYGLVSTVSDLGDDARTGDEQCTTTTYARNTGTWLLDRASRTETVAAKCGDPVTRPADVIADTLTYYDGATATDATPSKGLATEARVINGKGDGYDSKGTVSYDAYGRAVSTTDVYGKTSTLTYVPATGEVATSSIATNPLGHRISTVLDPLRGQPLTVTDANNKVSTTAYDPLGRVVKAWTPSHTASAYPNAPSYRFDYQVRNDAPVVVSSSTLGFDSRYSTSYTISDGLLRTRQTQVPSPDRAGRLVHETFYDTRGLAWRDSGTFYADGSAEGVLVTGQETKYPASTDTLYDGTGRPTAVISKKFGDETKRTTTSYGGDSVTVVPPQGGTARTTVTDARGRAVQLRDYTDPGRTAFQSATFDYDKLGRLSRHTDAGGASWQYTYDIKGRQVRVDDPDKGVSENTYDNGDRLTDAKNARGITLHSDYDALGRRTAVKQGSTTLTAWSYDTVAKGKLSAATRYANGAAYTFAVGSYNSAYQPVRTSVTIPSAEGALAGTYAWITAYNANTGQVETVDQPKLGDLPAESLVYDVTPSAGLPSTLDISGSDPIASGTTYDHYGRVLREEYGDFGVHLWQSNSYDEHTGSLTETISDRDTAPQRIDDTRYGHDPAGNITSISKSSGQDAQQVTDTQCFTTDALRRITEAWTTTGACPTAPSTANVGGPDAYWTSYTYDALGNRRTEKQHQPTGDINRTYTTPAPATGKPHSLTSVDQTGPSGSRSETFTYDETGNTTSHKVGTFSAQNLSWDAEGHLASTTQGALTTSYLYDADGNRLIRHDSGGATLYLPNGNEVALTAGGTPTGTRYYGFLGKTVAVRSHGQLSYLLSDHQGTATTSVDAATQAVTRRKSTTFGAPRGTAPATWPGRQSFVGGTTDPDTGLTHLGAREYDPATGRFLSVDPLLDSSDPQQWNAYAYSRNNPVTMADPSGRMQYDQATGISAGTSRQLQAEVNKVGTHRFTGHPASATSSDSCDLECHMNQKFDELAQKDTSPIIQPKSALDTMNLVNSSQLLGYVPTVTERVEGSEPYLDMKAGRFIGRPLRAGDEVQIGSSEAITESFSTRLSATVGTKIETDKLKALGIAKMEVSGSVTAETQSSTQKQVTNNINDTFKVKAEDEGKTLILIPVLQDVVITQTVELGFGKIVNIQHQHNVIGYEKQAATRTPDGMIFSSAPRASQ